MKKERGGQITLVKLLSVSIQERSTSLPDSLGQEGRAGRALAPPEGGQHEALGQAS